MPARVASGEGGSRAPARHRPPHEGCSPISLPLRNRLALGPRGSLPCPGPTAGQSRPVARLGSWPPVGVKRDLEDRVRNNNSQENSRYYIVSSGMPASGRGLCAPTALQSRAVHTANSPGRHRICGFSRGDQMMKPKKKSRVPCSPAYPSPPQPTRETRTRTRPEVPCSPAYPSPPTHPGGIREASGPSPSTHPLTSASPASAHRPTRHPAPDLAIERARAPAPHPSCSARPRQLPVPLPTT